MLKMGKTNIGNGFPTYIVLEAGATHYGLESALSMVDMVADTGANAIKFQIVDAKRLVPDKNTLFTYDYLADKQSNEIETVTESLQEILLRRELSYPEWEKVIAYCKSKNVDFFATATDENAMDFLAKAGVSCIKIASGDINFHHFLRMAAKYDWIVQIDTGNAYLSEVEEAVRVLENAGTNQIIINHCPSGYPAKHENVNLNVIKTLKLVYPYPIAFSDHNPGFTMDIAAVSLGANIIEKTITLDRTIKSPEHIMSLEKNDISCFVQTIRELELALGGARITAKNNSLTGRRSIHAATHIAKGSVITQEMLEYARPGNGIQAHLDCLIINRVATQEIEKGQKIDLAHIE